MRTILFSEQDNGNIGKRIANQLKWAEEREKAKGKIVTPFMRISTIHISTIMPSREDRWVEIAHKERRNRENKYLYYFGTLFSQKVEIYDFPIKIIGKKGKEEYLLAEQVPAFSVCMGCYVELWIKLSNKTGSNSTLIKMATNREEELGKIFKINNEILVPDILLNNHLNDYYSGWRQNIVNDITTIYEDFNGIFLLNEQKKIYL